MEKIEKTLKQIGLTKNEILVYLTLLKIGSSSASKISERSEIYRPYTYDTLERLQEKGLASFIVKDSKKLFKAVDPSQLAEIQKEKLIAINNIIPRLKKLIEIPKEESNVELYTGKKVIRVIQKDVLKDLLKNKGESLVIGVDEKKFMEVDPIIMEQFFNQMEKNKLKERILVRKGDNYLPAKKSTTTYKFLPKEFFDPTSTFIYGDNVAIVLFSEPLNGIIIKSKLIANAYRKQFELLWKIAKK